MTGVFSAIRHKGVKTWIYVILLVQCCLLCAYVTFFHMTSSSVTAPFSPLAEETTRSRRQGEPEVITRVASPYPARDGAQLQAARDGTGRGVARGKTVNADRELLPREIVVFTLPPPGAPGVPSNNSRRTGEIDPPHRRDSNASPVTTSGGDERGLSWTAPGAGAGGDRPYVEGDADVIKADSSNSSSNASDASATYLRVLYQNYTDTPLNFAGNLRRLIGLSAGDAFVLPNATAAHLFAARGNWSCLVPGTDLTSNRSGCPCGPGWYGAQCTIPGIVYIHSGVSKFAERFRVRTHPRRIINAIAFNIEFELLEARLSEHWDLVDVFVILESSYSHYGERKPLRLLDRLLRGYLSEYHSKICYLLLPHFPAGARENGWIMDQYHRTYIGKVGMRHVAGARPDDIYIYTDADEIPSREALIFLKLHHGVPEPFGFSLRWSVFGFFWKQYDPTRVMAGCTVGMLRYVFQNDVYQLRANTYHSQERLLNSYLQQSGSMVYDWYFADDGGGFAGWHCSWCLPPEGIRVKLTSAINADFPRWGNYPEKRDLNYIRNLIKTGTWFDDKSSFGTLVTNETDDYLAPGFMLEHFDRYKHLLDINYGG